MLGVGSVPDHNTASAAAMAKTSTKMINGPIHQWRKATASGCRSTGFPVNVRRRSSKTATAASPPATAARNVKRQCPAIKNGTHGSSGRAGLDGSTANPDIIANISSSRVVGSHGRLATDLRRLRADALPGHVIVARGHRAVAQNHAEDRRLRTVLAFPLIAVRGDVFVVYSTVVVEVARQHVEAAHERIGLRNIDCKRDAVGLVDWLGEHDSVAGSHAGDRDRSVQAAARTTARPFVTWASAGCRLSDIGSLAGYAFLVVVVCILTMRSRSLFIDEIAIVPEPDAFT
jgi:hypothetical protein